MRGDRVGELGVVLDLADGRDDFRRHLLVQLHVAFELGHHRARERLDLDGLADVLGDHGGLGLVIFVGAGVGLHGRARGAFHQHLDGAVGQLQQLQHRGERAGGKDRVGGRIVLGGVLLRREQDVPVALHHLFERANRLLAADEERHDHVRENDDVAQRQNRIGLDNAGLRQCTLLCCHFLFPVAAPPDSLRPTGGGTPCAQTIRFATRRETVQGAPASAEGPAEAPPAVQTKAAPTLSRSRARLVKRWSPQVPLSRRRDMFAASPEGPEIRLWIRRMRRTSRLAPNRCTAASPCLRRPPDR